VLRDVILVRSFPRSLIQLTLQVLQLPESIAAGTKSSSAVLPLLAPLLQTTMLSLLAASIPLRTTFTSVCLAVSHNGAIATFPSPKDIANAKSLHVFSFSLRGEMLVAESEGAFDMELWDQASQVAEGVCRYEGGGVEMDLGNAQNKLNLEKWIRDLIEEKAQKEQSWRDDV
jgi:exosome complex component RRP46